MASYMVGVSPENPRLRRGQEQRAPQDRRMKMLYEDFLGVIQVVPDTSESAASHGRENTDEAHPPPRLA